MSDPPTVTCHRCGRTCACLRVKGGTTYRPLAWTFPSAASPLVGLCGECRYATIGDAGNADGFIYHDERGP